VQWYSSVAWFGSHPVAPQLKTISPHSCSDCSSSLLVTHAKFGPLIVHITVNQRCYSDLDRTMFNSHPRCTRIISPRFFLVSQVLNLIFCPYFLIRGTFNDYASVCLSLYITNERTEHSLCSYARPTAAKFPSLCGTLHYKPKRIKYSSEKLVGRDSSVDIVTGYGLDGPGIETPAGARFFPPVQTGPGAHPASYTVGTGSFQGVKWPGRCVDHPPPSSAEVKERVQLYLYFSCGSSWPVGW
jgi:hypothetical protein